MTTGSCRRPYYDIGYNIDVNLSRFKEAIKEGLRPTIDENLGEFLTTFFEKYLFRISISTSLSGWNKQTYRRPTIFFILEHFNDSKDNESKLTTITRGLKVYWRLVKKPKVSF